MRKRAGEGAELAGLMAAVLGPSALGAGIGGAFSPTGTRLRGAGVGALTGPIGGGLHALLSNPKPDPAAQPAAKVAEAHMTAEQQAVYANIIVPAFIEKCAAFGRHFTPDTLETHLENAAMVQMHKESAEQDMSKQANVMLKKSLGLEAREVAQAADGEIKAAAARVLANPEIKKLLS